MSFSQADFFPFKIPQNLWSTSDNLVSTSLRIPGTRRGLQLLDLSIMDTPQVGDPPPLSQYPNPDHFSDRPWFEIPQPQDSSYNFGQGQYAAGGNHGNAAPMLYFQGGTMMMPGQGLFQGQEIVPAHPKKSGQPPKRRNRPPKDPRDKRSQKRKRTTAKPATCDYRNGATCDEECNSSTGSANTCCSSCSDGLACADPHCAIPCAESSCEKPICPEDCPLTTGLQRQQTQFQQGFVPSSERLSFLQQANAEPWNPVGSRTSPSVKEAYLDNCIDPALTDPDLNSQYHPEPESSSPPTPSMAQNMATPFSPEVSMQTPQFIGQTSQVSYSNESSTVVGTGGMFNSPMSGDWSANNFANAGHTHRMFNCTWDACNAFIPDEQFWMQHLHQVHLDPQYTYGCPLQSSDCPPIGANPLNHLQTQHGFDMNENTFSCPAPTCSPAQTYNDPAMLHNHFDQAHATPTQGLLHCRLSSCNGSFPDPNKLLSHIKSHQLPVPTPKVENVNQTDATNYPLAIPDNELLVAHTCKWKLEGSSICGEICGTEKDLQDHVKAKHLAVLSKSTGYICQWEHCGRPAKMGAKQGFSQRGKLERHMASHTNCKSLPVFP